jgi:cysteine desulfurase
MGIYLDYNASSPLDQRVLDEMIRVYKYYYGNADSRTHTFGQNAKSIVEQARSQISNLLNLDKNEVTFTSGATESDNIAVLGLARWGEENNRKHIISTKIEHKAILESLRHLVNRGFEIDLVDVDKTGRVNTSDILNKLRSDTLLVTMMHSNNETGIIQPVKEVGELLSRTDTYFHIDAAQTFGKLVPELKVINYDMLSLSGHKVYGPQGIGALILRIKNHRKPPIKPIMFGGGHESGIRPGTLPVALIAGLGKASELAGTEYMDWSDKDIKIKNNILDQLKNVHYIINGDQNYCMSNTINISFPGVDSEALMFSLKDLCALSNGSACTSHDYKPSHVLTAMGLENELIESAIRFSWGPSLENIDLVPLINAIKSMT